jgi:hypothetical protein
VARRLQQDPQVANVLAHVKKSLHRAGLAGRMLSSEEEQGIFDQVTRTLMQDPTVLAALQQIPSA